MRCAACHREALGLPYREVPRGAPAMTATPSGTSTPGHLRAIRKHILSAPLATKLLEDVAAADVEGWLQSKEGELGPATTNQLRRFVVGPWTAAVRAVVAGAPSCAGGAPDGRVRSRGMTTILRTPEERFSELPGFPFAPHWIDSLRGYDGVRVHYVDEGPRDARTFLCLHGEPTWSYLYRRMIPVFLEAGHRVVAPDFIGFGRSDKLADDAEYTFEFHRNFLLAVVEALDLRRMTLVVQDWGGLLGLTLPMEMPERFESLLVMNTALATGEVPLGEGFIAWRAYVNRNPDLGCGALLRRACPHLTDTEAAAYDAPFPDARFKAGVRRFPDLVPDALDAPGAAISRKARDWLGSAWRGRTFMAVGAKDPVLGPRVMNHLRTLIRGCPDPYVHSEAGHFIQEWGEDVARAALEHLG